MFTRSIRIVAIALLCGYGMDQASSADKKAADLVGEKVAFKVDARMTLDDSDESVTFESVFLPCFPKLADGDRILVDTLKGDAWAKVSDVVPWEIAEAYFSKILQGNSGNAGAYVARGLIRADAGKFKEAVEDHSQAVKLQPENPHCHVNRSLSLTELGRYREAIADIRIAQKLAPEDLAVMGNAAWLLATVPDQSLRNTNESLKLATKVCELTDFQDLNWLDTLAAAHANAGDFNSAVKWQIKALENEPENDEWKARLKLYLEKKPFRLSVSNEETTPVKK